MSQDRKQISRKKVDTYWKDCSNKGDFLTDDVQLNIGDYSESGMRLCYACGRSGGIEVCHIIPHSLGGEYKEENLFLLCNTCHKESPDVRDPKYFFEWVNSKQNYLASLFNSLLPHVTKFIEDNGEFDPDKFKGALTEVQQDISFHPGSSGESTNVAAARMALEKCKV